jgi:hypothetical protein
LLCFALLCFALLCFALLCFALLCFALHTALTFYQPLPFVFTEADARIMFDLLNKLKASGAAVPPKLLNHEAARAKPGAFVKKKKKE